MADLDAVADEVKGLSVKVAGLQPLVMEMHANMPRITIALETLARVSEKQESNIEDHKRIHFRITENELAVKELSGCHDDLERRFVSLREEHIVCTTTSKVQRGGLWARLKIKAAEKAVDLAVVAVLGFLVWVVLNHLRHYPLTAPMVGGGG